MPWIESDGGSTHMLFDSVGQRLARIMRSGNCWVAAIGEQPASSGRFSQLADAKMLVEKLVIPAEVNRA